MPFRKVYKALFGLRRFEKLLRPPRMYSNPRDPRRIDFDTALIAGRSAARSPENVQQLMKQHSAASVDELAAVLPDRRYHRRPLRRLRSILRAIGGGSIYNPDNALRRQLRRAGFYTHRDIKSRIQAIEDFE